MMSFIAMNGGPRATNAIQTLCSQIGKQAWVLAIGLLVGLLLHAHAAVLISEIMYHPAGEDQSEPGEYLELWNPGPKSVDLSGWAFEAGIQYIFPQGTVMQPGELIILAKDPNFLKTKYNLGGIRVFGPFQGNLSNAGERIRLVDQVGDKQLEVSYKDHGDWPAEADGTGHSLVFEDPTLPQDDPRNWRASYLIGGSPGWIERPQGSGPEQLVLIDVGTNAFYFKGTNEPTRGTIEWTLPEYVPGLDWQQGPSGFGYSNEEDELAYINTQLNDMQGQYISIYVRYQFALSEEQLGNLERLELTLVYDDGYVAYLNGQRILSNNLDGEPPAFNKTANSAIEYQPEVVDLYQFRRLLRPGRNVLAFQVHNASPSSSDCFISVRLVAYVKRPELRTDPRRQVCINEIYAAGGPGEPDWIELFNPSSDSIDLSGCWLSDDARLLNKYQLPQNTVIGPHSFLLLTSDQIGFRLAANGDAIYLTEPSLGYVLCAYAFGPQVQRCSIARWPDGSADWFYCSTPTPGQPNHVRRIGQVMISEIMYHDPAGSWYEFVEVTNYGDDAVDLSEWSLGGAIRFEFPQGTVLEPKASLVIADELDYFRERYPDFGGRVVGNYRGNLSNKTGTIRLLNRDDVVVDLVHYEDRDPWPLTPDGFGSSLERQCAAEDYLNPYQWGASLGRTATPGTAPALGQLTAPPTSPIVVSEFMYHPVGGLDDPAKGEFVELFNRSDEPVDLSGWLLLGDIVFEFPAGTMIQPAQVIVVAKDPETLCQLYGIKPDNVFGPYDGELSDGGGELYVVRPDGRVVDAVQWDDDFPWPSLADGAGTISLKGHSLVRLCAYQPGNVPINWAASRENEATPGILSSLSQCDLPPLVTNLVIEPLPVTATTSPMLKVQLHGGERVVKGQVEYWIDDPETEGEPHEIIPLLPQPDRPEEWVAQFPALRDNSIVRYRILFELDDGTQLLSPSPERDQFQWHAYFVEPTVNSRYPIYHLFISSKDWAQLHAWIAPGRVINNQPNPGWDMEVPAIFVAEGVVYDVTVRHQGSRWNRNNGPIITFPCPSHYNNGTAKLLSWRIRFPSYRDYHGIDILILQKQRGWPQHISFKMFELAGVPVPKTWWACLRVNGCDYNTRAFAIERPGADMLRRWYGEVGDLFKSEGYTGDEGPWSWGDERLIVGPLYGFTESQRYKYTYDRKTRNWVCDRSDLQPDLVEPLIEALHQARNKGKEALRNFLSEQFDVEEVLRYICTINYVGTFDDMFQNHYLYRSLRDGKWRVFPWDLDNTLGSGPYGEWNANPFRGADQARINADPQLRAMIGDIGNREGWWNRLKDSFFIAYQEEFLKKFLELNNTVFAPERMDLVIDEAAALYGASEADKNEVKNHIRKRHEYLNSWILPWVPQEALLTAKQQHGKIAVSWPAWLVGFKLQQATTLTGPWYDVPSDQIIVTNGLYQFELRPRANARFFRLVKE